MKDKKEGEPATIKLKEYIEANIPFEELKKVGFFGKDIRKTDYTKIAERVCIFFGFKSIYEYDNLNPRNKGNKINWQPYKVDSADMFIKDEFLN